MTTDITAGLQPFVYAQSPAATARRRLLAISLPLAALLLGTGEATFPKGLDNLTQSLSTATSEVTIATAHPGQFAVASLLVIFGLAALGVSFSAIATLAQDRGRTLATVVAVLGWLTTLCGVVMNTINNYALAAAASIHPATGVTAAIWFREDTWAAGNPLLVLYFFGMLLTVALAAVVLWRSRAVPRVAAVVFAAAFYLAIAAGPGPMPTLLQYIPFLAVTIYLAVKVWQPVPRPGQA
jgi:hypothetical protein